MKYPNIPPNTEAMEQNKENFNQSAGTATTIAINKTSGGIGKNEDSINEIQNNAGSA
jgi:hypothetical protein